MPLTPHDDDSVRTRNQRQQEEVRRLEEQARRQEGVDQRRFGDSFLDDEPPADGRVPTSAAAAGPTAFDIAAMMEMLQKQTRRQEEMVRRQEEEARREREESRREREMQARRLEENLIKNLHEILGTQLGEMKERVKHLEKSHETRFVEIESQIADVRKTLNVLKTGDKVAASVAAAPATHGFKVPPFDGSSSWSAYKIQFDAIVKANRWNKEQAMTALTVGRRDQALTVLEALGKDVTYEKLLETLENRYGDAHLEHAYRAKLNDRAQRRDENLQEWALEAEKMVRKAYQTSPVLIEERLVEVFANGIRNYEVRTAVKLGHHKKLKDALAHALEEEAVREDQRATHRVREVKKTSPSNPRPGPRCYNCNERGHMRRNCPKPLNRRDDQPLEGRVNHDDTQQQGNE